MNKIRTFHFIGVTTSQSLSMRLFPIWLTELQLPETGFRGYDIDVHTLDPYARILGEISCISKTDDDRGL